MRANDSKSSSASTMLLTIIAIALGGMAGTIGLIHQVGDLGPKVGDIVTFDPLGSMSRDIKARLPAIVADNKAGVACALDVRTMHAYGGSLIIEAREPDSKFGYRVHWSGQRSSNDGADCGASADLMLRLEDIEVLAMAAGGFGVPENRQPAIAWRAADSVN
jgi:hypothetical protein